MEQYADIAAFIPAAGLGTRLKPLTDNKPKALVYFGGMTMLEGVLDKLFQLGIRTFCINIHHYAEMMEAEIAQLQSKYNIIISDESDQLLDTGGGLVKAAGLLNEFKTILVHNVDVYAQIDYDLLLHTHLSEESDITMAVSARDTSRKLLFKDNELRGWKNFKTGEIIGEHDLENDNYMAFSGIHLVENEAVNSFAPKANMFPLIPWYVEKCNELKIVSWKHNAENWFDLGTPDRITLAEQKILNNK